MAIYLASPSVDIENRTTLDILFFSEWERDYKGTPAFFKTILKDIDCPVRAKEGNIRFCRSDYFCEYPEDEDFRGTWRALWDIKLQLKKPLKESVLLEDVFIESEAFDESSKFMGTTPDDLTFCVTIADFSNMEDLLEAQKQIDLKNNLDMNLSIEMRSTVISEGLFQLIINIGLVEKSFYEEGALEARIIQEICKKHRGTCHYTDRF
jgi:hypothetical protein